MARRLPHRVQVQTFTTVVGTDGTEARTFANNRERSARLTPLMGGERLLGGRDFPEATHMIEMHYDPKVTLSTGDRITHNSINYDIQYVEVVGERNREMKIVVKSERT